MVFLQGLSGSEAEEVDPAAGIFKPWFRLLFRNKSQVWTLFCLVFGVLEFIKAFRKGRPSLSVFI